VLLRESYRDEQGRSQKRTLANLSKLPRDMIDTLKAVLKGATVVGTGPQELEVERSLPHGHVAAALGMIRKIGLDRLILSASKDPASRRCCDLIVAMMVDRLVTPRSKLGFVRAVDEETASSSLGAILQLGRVKEREAYEALDWLLERQGRIENSLARRHLEDGVLVLYDVSSSYFEGRCCPLARYGHSRDHRKDRPQIVYGLLCTRQGLPIAVEVFDGNSADPSTLSAQVEKVKDRFGISRVVVVGDRGMITSARIRDDLRPANLDWITCLRAPAVQALAAEKGPLQLSLFDDRDLAEISAPELFPGERLIVCRNYELASERARKREDLLAATERELARIEAQVRRKNATLHDAAKIGLAVGAVLNTRKMAKHFVVTIGDGHLSWHRQLDQIEAEARLDGIYVIRTSVPAEHLDAAETVQVYKDLARVERAFRSLKSVDLEIRPIRHWTADRVRGHVLLCMLAYHVEWHLREVLAPLLFHDTDLAAAKAERTSPVVATEPSETVKAKKATKRSADGLRVMSFPDLLAHLGTLVRNTMRVPARPKHRFTLHSRPTALQQAAFGLLGLDPVRVQ
jgi:transposase